MDRLPLRHRGQGPVRLRPRQDARQPRRRTRQRRLRELGDRQGDPAGRKANATLPVANYQPYVDAAATVPPKAEPAHAQELYAILDVAMSGVLTRQDANIDSLLSDAETKANSMLATKG